MIENTVLSGNTGWLGLDEAKVLVAGAGGIGAACALGYAEVGAQVMVLDRDAESLSALAQRPGLGSIATAVVDLTQPGEAARAVAVATETLGGLDVALHCVGVNDRRPVLEFSDEEWDRVIEVNLTTAFRFTQAAGRHMVRQGSGRIVVLSSVSGLLAHKLHAPYAASKGALNQMMRVMAAEWAGSGVAVNAIAPGYLETGLTRAYLQGPGVREGLEGMIPAGRLGSPNDIVGPVLFLSSDRASFVTGQVLYVDGGRTLV